MRHRARLVLMVALTAAALGPATAEGQDIEAVAQVRGLTLPPGYYERVRQHPDFFEIKAGWISRTAQVMEASTSLTGTLPVVVILALFSDSPEPTATKEDIQSALFDGPSDYGTVSEFYGEVSGGRFAVTGQTLPWVRTSLTMQAVVRDSYGLGDDAGTGAYLFEATAAVDSMIDFGLFDNDGPDGIPNSGDDDGTVDAVAFQFLEVAASCGGPSIWPHRSRLQYWNNDVPFVTNDTRPDGSPIVVNDYTTQSAYDCGGVDVQKATTISHELAHVLGLPDFYDRSQGLLPEERRWVVGCWSLMAAGAWGCGTETRESWVRPTHIDAWGKIQLGWLGQVEEVASALDQEFTLGPVQTSEHVLKVPLAREEPADSNEYLLIEYRTQEGFDQDLPASGVLVYHVDPRIRNNRPCDTCPQHYRVGLLEADGDNSLRLNFQQGGNRGEAGDAWGVNGPGTLTNNTYPSTRLHSGATSPVTIYDISLQGGMAYITLSSATISISSLIQDFLNTAAPPLTVEEQDYLDSHGNQNGQYDVGDLRTYWYR